MLKSIMSIISFFYNNFVKSVKYNFYLNIKKKNIDINCF